MKLSKTHIYIAIAVLVFLVALSIYFYKQGKKTVSLQSLPGELPGNPSSGNVVGASNDEIKNVAQGLYNEMRGPNFLGHNMEFYKRALLFSDTDIIKLYNAFNAMYQADSQETLTQWLSGELFSSNLENEANVLIARLIKLNCL